MCVCLDLGRCDDSILTLSLSTGSREPKEDGKNGGNHNFSCHPTEGGGEREGHGGFALHLWISTIVEPCGHVSPESWNIPIPSRRIMDLGKKDICVHGFGAHHAGSIPHALDPLREARNEIVLPVVGTHVEPLRRLPARPFHVSQLGHRERVHFDSGKSRMGECVPGWIRRRACFGYYSGSFDDFCIRCYFSLFPMFRELLGTSRAS